MFMNSSSPLFDLIFALWPNDVEMAADMRVSRHCARRWIARGKIPMAYWPWLTNVCTVKFGRQITHESLVEATLARRGADDRRVGKLRLYPKGRRQDGQDQEAA